MQHAFVIPINVAPAFCVTHVPCRIPYLSGVQVCFVHESVKTAEVRRASGSVAERRKGTGGEPVRREIGETDSV